jgi:hypothetical protein
MAMSTLFPEDPGRDLPGTHVPGREMAAWWVPLVLGLCVSTAQACATEVPCGEQRDPLRLPGTLPLPHVCVSRRILGKLVGSWSTQTGDDAKKSPIWKETSFSSQKVQLRLPVLKNLGTEGQAKGVTGSHAQIERVSCQFGVHCPWGTWASLV